LTAKNARATFIGQLQQERKMTSDPQLSLELIKEFVIASHFDLPKVKSLLDEQPALLTVVHDWGPGGLEDGLGAAAHVGNRTIAEFFLAQGVSLTICAAAMLGQLDAVKAFIDRDTSLANARGAHSIPVMFHAAMSGNIKIAELLKSRGCHEGYNDAVHGAINYGHTAMVNWLLDNGADQLDVKDFQGKTPLQRATESNLPEVVDLLRQHGAVE
jgi:uncharacterized protein